MDKEKAERIRVLNDRFRRSGLGGDILNYTGHPRAGRLLDSFRIIAKMRISNRPNIKSPNIEVTRIKYWPHHCSCTNRVAPSFRTGSIFLFLVHLLFCALHIRETVT